MLVIFEVNTVTYISSVAYIDTSVFNYWLRLYCLFSLISLVPYVILTAVEICGGILYFISFEHSMIKSGSTAYVGS